MKEIEEILDILRKHKRELEERFSVKKIGIYGSFVRGEQTPGSDIDIYLKFNLKTLTYERYLGLIEYLEKMLSRKVDLITRDGVDTITISYIKDEIKRSIVYA